MPEYLSKEEIKQWRSSLERITLEEYAQRLGKVICEEKETHDVVDEMLEKSYYTDETKNSVYKSKNEKIGELGRQSFEIEKNLDIQEILKAAKKDIEKKNKKLDKTIQDKSIENIQLTFKKNLTPRESAVLDHFLNNKNTIVYAKDLAEVLELPRDYVYKYIKNLRAKMNEDALQNAENGGFILKA